MKVEKQAHTFSPVTISITFETQEELNDFCKVCSVVSKNDLANLVSYKSNYSALGFDDMRMVDNFYNFATQAYKETR